MIKTIIVEDDPMVAQINRRYLDTANDIQVAAVFDNGKDALAYIEDEEPDLIILDVYMPVMNGLELLREIRKADIQSDVIMVTAANDVKNVEEALRLGIVDYLVKPFEYERFMEAIEKYRKKAHVLKDASTLNQDAIDALVSVDAPQPQAPARDLKKGLQQRTLDMIRSHLDKMKGETCTCDTLAGVVGLSKVTVRRYLNYLAEIGEIDSSVDYETGGRPCIKYFIRPDSVEKKDEAAEENGSDGEEKK